MSDLAAGPHNSSHYAKETLLQQLSKQNPKLAGFLGFSRQEVCT